MKAQILSIITTVQVDQFQVDISYDFNTCEIEIFVDAHREVRWYFKPERTIYNHMNMVTLAVEAVSKMKKRQELLWDNPFRDY